MNKNLTHLLSIGCFLLIGFSANAQLKVGSNPTTITANTNLEAEAANGMRVVITKDLGYLGVGIASPTQRLHVSGGALISSLIGVGTRMVVADATGVLSAQSIPAVQLGSVSVILNANSYERAALTGDVTAAQNSNVLTIGNAAVTTAKIADDAIVSTKILDGTIATVDLANGAVTNTKMSAGAGTAGRIPIANAAGDITYQDAATASVNIYTQNGTLTGNRVVTQGTNNINFDGAGNFTKIGGNVGIGTLSPVHKLGIVGQSGPFGGARTDGIFSISDGTGVDGDTYIQMGVVTDAYAWLQAGDPGVSVRSFAINPNGGNVGIGTTTPSQKLHVDGGALVSSLIGVGTRMVVADAAGVLSAQSIPAVQLGSVSVILNANSYERAALTGDVTAAQNSNVLTIENAAVTTAKIADGAIVSTKILDGTIATVDLANGAVTNTKMSAGAGTAGRIPIANAAGDITYQDAATASVNIYTQNGTLTGDRIVSQGTNTLSFTGSVAVGGSVGYGIRKITAARTLDATDRTILGNAFAAGFVITLPAPSTCAGREYIIRKVDESINAITFTFTGIVANNAIRLSDSSATAGTYTNTLNYVKTLRIQSDGTDWYLID